MGRTVHNIPLSPSHRQNDPTGQNINLEFNTTFSTQKEEISIAIIAAESKYGQASITGGASSDTDAR